MNYSEKLSKEASPKDDDESALMKDVPYQEAVGCLMSIPTTRAAIAKNGGYIPRTKHIDIRHHFIKDALSRGVVKLAYVGTEEQVVEGLTEPQQRRKFEECRKMMGISAARGGVLKRYLSKP